jgi:hypothetical protein
MVKTRQNIVAEQDEEYSAALAEMRRRDDEQRRIDASAAAEKEERQKRVDDAARRRAALKEVTADTSADNIVALRFQVPFRGVAARSFLRTDTVQSLFDFIDAEVFPSEPTLRFGFPPTAIGRDDRAKTILELGLVHRDTLQVILEED